MKNTLIFLTIVPFLPLINVDWNAIYQAVRHDTTMTGEGITGSELKVDTSIISTKANVLVIAADKVTAAGAASESIGGVKTFSSDPIIPDEAYDATAWNGVLEPPTKNAVRDKIETMSAGSGLNFQQVLGITALRL